jgi:hypothetical protein
MAAELVAETRDVIAARANVEPPRLLGFGLRLVGRLVRALGATLEVTPARAGRVSASPCRRMGERRGGQLQPSA